MASGKCDCGKVKYKLPRKPREIANCHCTICQTLHHQPYVSFAKYDAEDVNYVGVDHIVNIASSERASRGYCTLCKKLIYMYYNGSDNIWMNADTFNFNTDRIKHYNIYTDTAVVLY